MVKVSDCIGCELFPCTDIDVSAYRIPNPELALEKISLVMIAEAAPVEKQNDFYAGGDALFAQTTLLAFRDAGIPVSSVDELLENGVYLTTAVKCAKTSYGIQTETVKECSHILEQELALFPKVKVILLMGDTAIKGLNAIARRQGEPRVIPAGSTYKIRTGEFYYHGCRVFPSYLQAGPSFFIEKSKRRMIAEDIKAAYAQR
jgi:hypothetical protein